MGKVRHIEVNQLWLQQKVSEGIVKVDKIGAEENFADHLTKYLNADGIQFRYTGTSQWIAEGRHELMPKRAR